MIILGIIKLIFVWIKRILLTTFYYLYSDFITKILNSGSLVFSGIVIYLWYFLRESINCVG